MSGPAFTRRGPRRLACRRLQEDQVLHERKRWLRRARSAGAADAYDLVLAHRAGRRHGAPAVRRRRSPRRHRRALVRDAANCAAAADVRQPRHRDFDRYGSAQPADLHLRQLSGRDRVQRAAPPDASFPARRSPAIDRGVRVRERLSGVRRTARQYRSAGESGCAQDSRPRAGRDLRGSGHQRGERMNLADRLREVVRTNETTGSSATSPAESGSSRISTDLEPGVSRPCVEQILGGEFREVAGRRSFVVVRRFDAERRHGRSAIGELADRLDSAHGSAPLVSVAAARAPFIFFDLETTGLSGGAGTHVFLVGCGWFDEQRSFVTAQHLLLDFPSEKTMLGAVADDLARAGALVSFNGKSFDAPVLETRYLFHRLASPCAALPHVDVLHPARRFWGRDGEAGCSLISLERQVLGARRQGDVPGFEIPGRYFQFIRSGDARPLAAVLEHNRLDLLSLAGLAAQLLHLLEQGPDAARNAREALALGRLYTRAGLEARADDAHRRALGLCGAGPVRTEALRALALAARRKRQYEVAAERWRELLAMPNCPRAAAREATEALAIHHEHRNRDLDAAKTFALQSLELEPSGGWPGAG